jgi:hypothetical protein
LASGARRHRRRRWPRSPIDGPDAGAPLSRVEIETRGIARGAANLIPLRNLARDQWGIGLCGSSDTKRSPPVAGCRTSVADLDADIFPRTEEVRQSLTSSERPHQNLISIAAAQLHDSKWAPSNRKQVKINNVSAPTLPPPVSHHRPVVAYALTLRRVSDLRRYGAVGSR